MKVVNILCLLMVLSLMCSCVARQIEFEDVTVKSGLHKLGNKAAAWADLNDDGWPDIVSNGRLWKNIKGERFADVTKDSGINKVRGGCVVADFNGDGKKDIYFFANGGCLYLGQGNFKFIKGKAFKNPAGATRGACRCGFE